MARLLIDGYNLLPATEYSTREELISALSTYHRMKSHDVTVVFDGTHQGTGSGDWGHTAGIEVIFTPITVQADDVIEEMLRAPRGSEWTIISSDRRIQNAARRANATFVSAQEFARKLKQAQSTHADGASEVPVWMEGREEEFVGKKSKPSPPSEKLTKEERKRKKAMKKL